MELMSQHFRQYQLHAQTHTHPFNGPFSRTTRVSRYQNGKTNLDFTEARDSECQWHQLGHMQVCTSLQTDNVFFKNVGKVQSGKQINKKHFQINSNEIDL